MNKNNYSIITNFGCHWKCKYCITKQVNIPLTNISQVINTVKNLKNIKFLSISGGGDPLYNIFENDKVIEFYKTLSGFCKDKSIEFKLHTSYISSEYNEIFNLFDRVVFHVDLTKEFYYFLNKIKDLDIISKKRIVYVGTKDTILTDIMGVALFCKENNIEFSVRQEILENFTPSNYLSEELSMLQKINLIHYTTQNDYNNYIVNDKIFTTFKNIV